MDNSNKSSFLRKTIDNIDISPKTIRNFIYKALFFIGAVALIVYFLPKDAKFSYQYEEGQTWTNETLVANFDFPLYKDKNYLQQERKEVLAKYLHPYFHQDDSIGKQAILKFKEDYTQTLSKRLPSNTYYNYILKTLQDIYKTGIISTEHNKKLAENNTQFIMISQDKLAAERPVNRLYTVQSAYEKLTDGESLGFKPEVLKSCDLNNYIIPNLVFESERTETAKKELQASVSERYGMVHTGEIIVNKGDYITNEVYNKLQSYKKEFLNKSESGTQQYQHLLGYILFVGIMMFSFMLYIEIFRKDFYSRKRSLTLLFLIIVFTNIITALINDTDTSVYIIPYAMLPIIISIFLDTRTAIAAHIVTILMCSIIVDSPHEFILLQLAAGMVSVYSLRELSKRSELIKSAFIIFLTYSFMFLATELIAKGDISRVNLSMYQYFIINGFLLLFTYPLLFLLEKIFGFTSNVTLVELSDTNNPLLRRMSEVAPGTFQHSMQMANLASEAAVHIGANSQLVRTGALYHDIGKMENPAFFTENQSGGINPHDQLTDEQSAQVIVQHIYDGMRLAKENNLPQAIKDFITTHHGRGTAKFFFTRWQNDHPNEEVDIQKFSYPGPNPFTKETAILMMADSVEAASRSLKEYTEESISNIVEKIIDSQVEDGYFKECPITFQDIATVKAVFKEKLKIVHHTRISYPELKTPKSK